MFDMMDMLQGMQEQQNERLREITIETEAGDGMVKVKANALQELLNISIDPSLLDPDDAEQLEDLVLTAVNRAMETARITADEEMQKMAQDIMPPGFDFPG